MKRSASENIWLVIKYVLLIGFTILCVYPLVWLFLASFKTNAELYTNTWGLPEQWSMTNYVNAVVKGGVFRYFGNSVIIAVSCGSGYCNPCNNGILCNCQNALEACKPYT